MLRAQLDGLWQANAEAWDYYALLSGRAVGALEWRGVLLDRITQGWALDRVRDLLARLDLILMYIEPEHQPKASG